MLIFALVVGAFGIRSEQAALDLIIVGFGFGAVAFSFFIALNILGAHGPTARFLARTGGYIVVAFVQANVLLVAFLLLAVLGLA